MFAVKLVLDMSQDLCSAATVGTQQLGLPRSHSNSDFLATRQAHIPIKSRACSQDRESVEPTTSGRPHQEAALWSLVQRVADLVRIFRRKMILINLAYKCVCVCVCVCVCAYTRERQRECVRESACAYTSRSIEAIYRASALMRHIMYTLMRICACASALRVMCL